MAAAEFEALGLDTVVITQLAVLSSEADQLDDDAITEKLSEVLGGKGVRASASIEGKKVKVDAPTIYKEFKGEWNRESSDHSKGILRYRGELEGHYKIGVTLNQKKTIIVFKKILKADSGPPADHKPDAVYFGRGTSTSLVAGVGDGNWGTIN